MVTSFNASCITNGSFVTMIGVVSVASATTLPLKVTEENTLEPKVIISFTSIHSSEKKVFVFHYLVTHEITSDVLSPGVVVASFVVPDVVPTPKKFTRYRN